MTAGVNLDGAQTKMPSIRRAECKMTDWVLRSYGLGLTKCCFKTASLVAQR